MGRVAVPTAVVVAAVLVAGQVVQGLGGPSPAAVLAQAVGGGPPPSAAPPVVAARCTRCTPAQIYALARWAGFTPDQAATMTAVALAESGGNAEAHNPRGEDSRGLFQVNQAVHPEYAGVDLYDPAVNARAAYVVSHGGTDISPWATTHGGAAAAYLRYRAEAQAAAVAHGDGPGRGMWAGLAGYGDRTPAG